MAGIMLMLLGRWARRLLVVVCHHLLLVRRRRRNRLLVRFRLRRWRLPWFFHIEVVTVFVVVVVAALGSEGSTEGLGKESIAIGGSGNVRSPVGVRPRLLPTRCCMRGVGGSAGGGTPLARWCGSGRMRVAWGGPPIT